MSGTPIKVDVFSDFHLQGASAPEWKQRYVQLSPGTMRSTLTEATSGRVHLFRKWMSERQRHGAAGAHLPGRRLPSLARRAALAATSEGAVVSSSRAGSSRRDAAAASTALWHARAARAPA